MTDRPGLGNDERLFVTAVELNASGLASDWWEAVLNGLTTSTVPNLSAPMVLGILAAAVALSIPRSTWRWFGLYVTFVHELGHAFAALTSGRFVHGLKIGLDHSGQLVSSGRGRAGAAWSGFWGYPAPAVVGAALVASVSAGWAGAAMTVGALVLLVALIFLRNLTGILVALCSAAIAQALVMFAGPLLVSYAALALGIALGVGSVRDLGKVVTVHISRRHHLAASDAFILARSTGIPSVLWLAAFTAVIAASAAYSGWHVWVLLSS